MEADSVTLSDDEVRERFSAYHDGELSPAESAFVRKRLDEDRALAAEYERFAKMLGGLASLGAPALDARPGVAPEEPGLDLLSGVQDRLHKRSQGKFYGARWTRLAGVRPLEVIAAAVLVVLLLAWLGMTYISGLRPAEPSAPPASGAAR